MKLDDTILEAVARKICMQMGADPDEEIVHQIGTFNRTSIPRWRTIIDRILDMHLNMLIVKELESYK